MDLEELKKRLRHHDDARLYREADALMSEAADAIESLQRELATMPPNCVHVQIDKDGRRIVGIRCEDEAELPWLNELGQDLVRGW